MPGSSRYPGEYVEQHDASARAIAGVPTAITAFIGGAPRGPLNDPVHVQSFADYERSFGGLSGDSLMSFAVHHFFLNGGRDARIVRVHAPSAAGEDDLASAGLAAEGGGSPLVVQATDPGQWGNTLRLIVDHETRDKDDPAPVLFNLFIEGRSSIPPNAVVAAEAHRNLSIDPDSNRFVTRVLARESDLVRVDPAAPLPATRPDLTVPFVQLVGGDDGLTISDAQIVGSGLRDARAGLWVLERVDLFNLLCIPPYSDVDDVAPATWDIAAQYCVNRRAVLLIDPPRAWNSADDIDDAAVSTHVVARSANAALYFPSVRAANPLRENRLETFVPSGAVAGVIARTDGARGVWKAPAGQDATLVGVQELAVGLADRQIETINRHGVNCLRSFSSTGSVVWGTRTLAGADALASEWKYLPVRRLALYIEQSVARGTQWAGFEPNDEPLWSQIRLNVGAFMQGLFRQGAFQGATAREGWFVRCDRETTTQSDIERGIANIIVGFAPLRPAEFVVLEIKQSAGLPRV